MKRKAFPLLLLLPFALLAQSTEELIPRIQVLMEENYVFLDKAKEASAHLQSLSSSGHFDHLTNPPELAKELSVQLQKITNDRHLNVAPPRERSRRERSVSLDLDFHVKNLERFRSRGFGEVNLFPGNVGYLHIRGFRVEDFDKVDPVMKYLETADAIIIDLRDNSGGNGPIVGYLSSYFLPTGDTLSTMYERRKDLTEFYVTEEVKGKKRLDVPLFLLTNSKTFSAAESFAYNLQAMGRATTIGEKSGGGAHPVNFLRLPDGYRLVVPVARPINPITKTNWEGTGVIPEIPTMSDSIIHIAKLQASKASKTYRSEFFEELKSLVEKQDIDDEETESVFLLLKKILARRHLESFMINDIGYWCLRDGYTSSAMAVFAANVRLFPTSPNAHDSFAEVLALQEKNEEALVHYEKAVELARTKNDRDLKAFEENLAAMKKKLNK